MLAFKYILTQCHSLPRKFTLTSDCVLHSSATSQSPQASVSMLNFGRTILKKKTSSTVSPRVQKLKLAQKWIMEQDSDNSTAGTLKNQDVSMAQMNCRALRCGP